MSCSSEDLQKFSEIVKDEIGETNLPEAIQTVKRIISEKYLDLRLPPDINGIVERCLRTCKFDCVRAATQVHSFFKYLFDCRLLHGEMLYLPNIQKEYFLDSLGFGVLKIRDSKGRMVLLTRIERLPSAGFSLDKAVATCFMVLDEMTRCSVETQRLGVVFVADFKGFEYGHAKQYTIARIKSKVKIIQGSMPVRFKSFHIVRSPLLFKYIFSLMKPFLKEKIRNRIHFHGHDLTQFHEEVSPDILPEYLGGKIPEDEYADLDFKRSLCAKDNYYKELFRYGYFTNEENGAE